MDSWRQHEAGTVNAEPGVQVYEDPDAQASPLDPVYESGLSDKPVLYPIPGAYVGTCGVTAGGGLAAGNTRHQRRRTGQRPHRLLKARRARGESSNEA